MLWETGIIRNLRHQWIEAMESDRGEGGERREGGGERRGGGKGGEGVEGEGREGGKEGEGGREGGGGVGREKRRERGERRGEREGRKSKRGGREEERGERGGGGREGRGEERGGGRGRGGEGERKVGGEQSNGRGRGEDGGGGGAGDREVEGDGESRRARRGGGEGGGRHTGAAVRGGFRCLMARRAREAARRSRTRARGRRGAVGDGSVSLPRAGGARARAPGARPAWLVCSVGGRGPAGGGGRRRAAWAGRAGGRAARGGRGGVGPDGGLPAGCCCLLHGGARGVCLAARGRVRLASRLVSVGRCAGPGGRRTGGARVSLCLARLAQRRLAAGAPGLLGGVAHAAWALGREADVAARAAGVSGGVGRARVRGQLGASGVPVGGRSRAGRRAGATRDRRVRGVGARCRFRRSGVACGPARLVCCAGRRLGRVGGSYGGRAGPCVGLAGG